MTQFLKETFFRRTLTKPEFELLSTIENLGGFSPENWSSTKSQSTIDSFINRGFLAPSEDGTYVVTRAGEAAMNDFEGVPMDEARKSNNGASLHEQGPDLGPKVVSKYNNLKEIVDAAVEKKRSTRAQKLDAAEQSRLRFALMFATQEAAKYGYVKGFDKGYTEAEQEMIAQQQKDEPVEF